MELWDARQILSLIDLMKLLLYEPTTFFSKPFLVERGEKNLRGWAKAQSFSSKLNISESDHCWLIRLLRACCSSLLLENSIHVSFCPAMGTRTLATQHSAGGKQIHLCPMKAHSLEICSVERQLWRRECTLSREPVSDLVRLSWNVTWLDRHAPFWAHRKNFTDQTAEDGNVWCPPPP